MTTIAQASETLVRDGYVVLPRHFDTRWIDALSDAFEAVMGDTTLTDRVSCINGEQVRIRRNRGPSASLPSALNAALTEPTVQAIIRAYFSSFDGPRVNDEHINVKVEVEHNRSEGGSNSSLWHYDRVPSVKMSIYLDETCLDAGALEVLPGSHTATRRLALAALERDPNPLHLLNYFEGSSAFDALALEGEPGTVILFDTFCIHRGGHLEPGYHRRNLRGITWARPLLPGYFKLPPSSLDRYPTFAEIPFRPAFVGPSDAIAPASMFNPAADHPGRSSSG